MQNNRVKFLHNRDFISRHTYGHVRQAPQWTDAATGDRNNGHALDPGSLGGTNEVLRFATGAEANERVTRAPIGCYLPSKDRIEAIVVRDGGEDRGIGG